MSRISSTESQFPVFVPGDSTTRSQEVSSSNSSFKMFHGSVDEFDRSRRSSSESGYSDTNMSPVEQYENADMKSKIMEDSLSNDLSKLQMRDLPSDHFPSQMYTYQWDQSSVWGETVNDTPRQVTKKKISTSLHASGFQHFSEDVATAAKTPFDQSNYEEYISDPEKPLEDWLRLRLQLKTTNTNYNPNISTLPIQATTSADVPKRLHVSNIPFRFRELHLYYMFGQFGEVTDSEIIYNDKGSKGFGFVTLSKGRDADRAQFVLHGTAVEGREIEVNLATPKMVPTSRSRPTSSPLSPSWLYNYPPSIPSGNAFPSTGTQSAITLLEAQTRLAEAQLVVLQMQQKLIYSQYSDDKSKVNLSGGEGKREVVGTIGEWQGQYQML